MTFGIGGHMMDPYPYTEEDVQDMKAADDIRGRVQAAYDKLYPTTALVKRTKYWEGYADALRDVLEELV